MSVNSKTVLLVDDEAPHLEKMRRALGAAGYSVVLGWDYDSALSGFQQHLGVIDILVTDLALPGRNGYELAQALRAIQPSLKVLFTSAQAGAELRRFYEITPPMDDSFLEKPYQGADLVDRVRRLLEQAKCGSAGV